MRNYSNPTNMYVTGGGYADQREFTYERNEYTSQPFHVYVNEGSWIAMSCMIFAYDLADAFCVVREYIEWFDAQLDIMRERYNSMSKDNQRHHLAATLESKTKRLDTLKRSIDSAHRTMKITPVKKNQFFKIGWAGNDTW